MNYNEIREQVDKQVSQWRMLQERRNINVHFSPKALDFICLMIENIESDKSTFWKFRELEYKNAQEFAVSLIPNALNELLPFPNFSRGSTYRNSDEIQISSWEIWHSLSGILKRFCFIPKKN